MEADYEVSTTFIIFFFETWNLINVFAHFKYVTNTGSVAVFRTNKNATNYRLIQIDFKQPEEANWKTLIEQNPSDCLDWATCVGGNKLVLCYIQDVKVWNFKISFFFSGIFLIFFLNHYQILRERKRFKKSIDVCHLKKYPRIYIQNL